MKKLFHLFLIIAVLALSSPALASVDVCEDNTLDCKPASAVIFDSNFNVTGNYGVQTVTLATANTGTLTLASSSTIITGTAVPYILIRKNIGGAGNDNTGVGTELADGTEGWEVILQADSIASGSSWIVTPATSTGFDSLTFDAAGERAHLLFVDSTSGWVVKSSTATVNLTL